MSNNGIFAVNAKTGTKTFIEYTDEEQAIQDAKNAKFNNEIRSVIKNLGEKISNNTSVILNESHEDEDK